MKHLTVTQIFLGYNVSEVFIDHIVLFEEK